MKKFKWSVNKIISSILMSSCLLVGLFVGVFSFKNANVSMQNETSIEQSIDGLNTSPLTDDSLFLETTLRNVSVYHYTYGAWNSDSIPEGSKVYFTSEPKVNDDVTSILKNFYVLDSKDNAVVGTFKINAINIESGTLTITFSPTNTLAYNVTSFTIYYSTLYNELYYNGSGFYSTSDCSGTKITLSYDFQELNNGATIYISKELNISGEFELSADKTIYIKPYNLTSDNMINVNADSSLIGNIIIDGQNSKKTLINVASANLILQGVILQNNQGVAINVASKTLTLINTTITNISVNSRNLSPITMTRGAIVNIENNSKLTNLFSYYQGGAIYSVDSELTITNSTILNCSTYISGSTATSTKGGAIYFDGVEGSDDVEFTITNSTIENCKSETAGSIYLTNAKLHLTSTKNESGELQTTSITNSITANTSDLYADIEARDKSIVYLSGKLNIQASIGVIVSNEKWVSSSTIQLKDFYKTGENANLINEESKINVKIIGATGTNANINQLNKSSLVTCAGNIITDPNDDNMTNLKDVLSLNNIFNLVNKDLNYNFRVVTCEIATNKELAGICLDWFDNNSTIYFDPVSGSDANIGDNPASAVKSWEKVIRATMGNTIVNLLSTWTLDETDETSIYNTTTSTITINGANGEDNGGCARKIEKIVRNAGFSGEMINTTKSLILQDIVLDGGDLSASSSAILYSASGVTITINAGSSFVNNYRSHGSTTLSGSAIHLDNASATLVINKGTLFSNNTAINCFEIFAKANKITVSGLNLNNNSNYGSAYLEATNTSSKISNSLFANATIGLVTGGITLDGATINNTNYGLVVSNSVTTTNCQISGNTFAISSYVDSPVNLTIGTTTIKNNDCLVAGNKFNSANASQLNITFNQDLTIFSKSETQINTSGSLTFSQNLTINNCRDESVIKAGSLVLNEYAYAEVYDNTTRPFEIGGSVTISYGYFVNNKHALGDGGVIKATGKVTITEASFYNNSATSGDGGAFYTSSDVSINTLAVFNNNVASSSGGAIYALGNLIIAKDGYFYGNAAGTNSSCKGGAIYANSVTTNNSGTTEFKFNSAYDGGAIYTSTLTPCKTVFQNNSATNNGGAIYINYSEITFDPNVETYYQYNTATNGGFIYCQNDEGNVNVTISSANAKLFYNTASTNGGAIYTDGSVTISNGTFSYNYAGTDGGVIYSASTVNINTSKSTFNNNTAKSGNGGVIYTSGIVTVSVGSEFTNNYAGADGGVIYSTNTTKSYTNSATTSVHSVNISNSNAIFSSNTAESDGGVIFTSGSVYLYGTYDSNYAGANGGVAYSTTHARTYAGTFSNNTAGANGGVIYLSTTSSTDSYVYLYSGGTFSSNYAGNDGGVVFGDYIYNCTINANCSNNTAGGNGGVVCVKTTTSSSSRKVIVSGSYNINNNKALYGAVIYTNGVVELSSATFSNNLAIGSGGIVFGGYSFKISSGTYTENGAELDAGGIIYSTTSQGKTTVSGGTFSRNYAKKTGSVFYLPNETVTFSGTVNINADNCIEENGDSQANVIIKKTIIASEDIYIRASLGVIAGTSTSSCPIEFVFDLYDPAGYLLIKVIGNKSANNYLIKGPTNRELDVSDEDYDSDDFVFYSQRYQSTNEVNSYSDAKFTSSFTSKLLGYWVGTSTNTSGEVSGNANSGNKVHKNNPVIGCKTISSWNYSYDKSGWTLFKNYKYQYYYYKDIYLKLGSTGDSTTTDSNDTNNKSNNMGNSTTGVSGGSSGSISSAGSYATKYNLYYQQGAITGPSDSESEYIFGSVTDLNNFVIENTKSNSVNSFIVTLRSNLKINEKLENVHIKLNGWGVEVSSNYASGITFDGTSDGTSGGTIQASDGTTFTNCKFINFTKSDVINSSDGDLTFSSCIFDSSNTKKLIVSGGNLTFNGNSYVKSSLTEAIKIAAASYSITFNGGVLDLSGSNVIICKEFTMNGGTLILSGSAISTNFGLTIKNGNIVSTNATIDGNVKIQTGTNNVNISGSQFTADSFTLSGNLNITAKLSGSITINSLNNGSVVNILANTVGATIATFTGTVPTDWEYMIKAYDSSNNTLKLTLNVSEVKVGNVVSSNIWYFDPNSAVNYSGSTDKAYFEALGGVYYSSIDTLISDYSSASTKPIVYVVSTWNITTNTNKNGGDIILTRWGGFVGNIISVTLNANITLTNFSFNGNGVYNSDPIISIQPSTASVKINLTLTDVNIYNCKSSTSAIYVNRYGYTGNRNTSLTINKGNYYNNSSSSNGAVIYANYSSTINISGAKFINNYSANQGGCLYLNYCETINIGNNSVFDKNVSERNGGVCYISTYNVGELNITGNAVFTNNETKGNNDGAVFYAHGLKKFNIGSTGTEENPIFSNNISAYWGGVIWFYSSNGSISIYGGTFSNNIAKQSGGIIYMSDGTLEIYGGDFINNSATSYGGVIYMQANCKLTINGGNFKSNLVGSYGGIVYLGSSSDTDYKWEININGGVFSKNKASGNGSIIYAKATSGDYANNNGHYANSGIIKITKGIFENNTCCGSGGLFYAEVINNSTNSSYYSTLDFIVEGVIGEGNKNSVEIKENNFVAKDKTLNGLIFLKGDIRFSIKNCDIYNNSVNLSNTTSTKYSLNGGLVYFESTRLNVGQNLAFSIVDCNIYNNEISYIASGTSNNASYVSNIYGGLIYIDSVSAPTISGSNIYNNNVIVKAISASTSSSANAEFEAGIYGGAVYVAEEVNLEIKGGVLKNNSVQSLFEKVNTSANLKYKLIACGGAIYSNGKVYVKDNCEVSGNTANNGGAIYSNGSVFVTDSRLYGNNAKIASAIYSGENVEISGSTIAKNVSDEKIIYAVGELLITESSKIISNEATAGEILYASAIDVNSSTISGNIISSVAIINSASYLSVNNSNISGNNIGAGILYIANGAVSFTGNSLSEIYGNYSNAYAIIHNNSHNLSIKNYSIKYNVNNSSNGEGGAIYLGADATGTTVLENNEFIGNYAKNGGSIYLAQNAQKFKLDINGGGLDAKNMNGALYIAPQVEFVLLDGSIFEGNVTGYVDTEGNGAIYNNGELTIENAIFTGNVATNGGVIYNSATGSITLIKAVITNNNATNGGAIYNEGKFNIASVVISGNKATNGGVNATNGGVIYNTGNLSINTCEIIKETSDSYEGKNTATNGGFIFNSGTFVINGGEFGLSEAIENGGFIYNTGSFVMNDGKIIGNTAVINGGAIYNEGKLIINNGEISSNSAGNSGSAIYLGIGARLDMFDGVIANGGDNNAIYALQATINLRNVSINGNDTAMGAIYLDNSELYMLDTALSDNNSIENGGAITAVNNSVITARRVNFVTNTSANGGAIFASGSTIDMRSGLFSGNKALSGNGGAIFANKYSNINSFISLEEVNFKTNTATTSGGAIYAENTLGEILDGIFSDNQAIDGAGIYFGTGSNITIDGGSINKNTSTENGAIYISNNATEIQIGNISIENNTANNGAGLFMASGNGVVVTLYGDVTFNENENKIIENSGDLYYGGGKLHIKGSSKIVFNNDLLYFTQDVDKYILEPGLREGSNIVVDFANTVTNENKFVGAYSNNLYITSNDVKYVSCGSLIAKLKLVGSVNQIAFEIPSTSQLSVIVSDKVVTVDGDAHTIDDNEFKVYYRGSSVVNYKIYYKLGDINFDDNKGIDYKNLLEQSNFTKEEFESDIETVVGGLELSSECPSFREEKEYRIGYLVVYLYDRGDEYYNSYYVTGVVTLNIVARTLNLEKAPVATIAQTENGILLSKASFSGGLVTSDGYAVSGSWKITHTSAGSEIVSDNYNPEVSYLATFIPYASNLFGEQTIKCDVDVKVYYSNLYYQVNSDSKGLFSLTKDATGVISITLQKAIESMQDNGNIYFNSSYKFTDAEKDNGLASLNINKTINFIKISNSSIFNLSSDESLSVNVGVGGLYVYDNSTNNIGALFTNAGTLQLGSGVNICNFKFSRSAITNSGTLSLNGCKIYSSGVNSTDGIIDNQGGTVYVNGGEYFGNYGNNGSLINSKGGSVYINGGEIYGNSSVDGGAIYMNGGSLVLNGGEIRHNTATNSGGAVYAGLGADSKPCSVNQNGTKIILNKASIDGGICLVPSTNQVEAVYILNNKVVSAEELMTSYRADNITTLKPADESDKGEILNKVIIVLSYIAIGLIGLMIIKRKQEKNIKNIFKK